MAGKVFNHSRPTINLDIFDSLYIFSFFTTYCMNMNKEKEMNLNRKHLKRIPVWIPNSQSVVYFVTMCCANRRSIFSNAKAVKIALESFLKVAKVAKWNIIQICFMPDHVHFFISPLVDREQKLSSVIQRWKSSSKQRLNHLGIVKGDVWQKEFFDRLLRSDESLTDKWRYVEMNPVRAGLSSTPEEFQNIGSPNEILRKLSSL